MYKSALFLGFCLVFLPVLILGQTTPSLQVDGDAPSSYVGSRVKRAGDVNGDGIADFMYRTYSNSQSMDAVEIRSGADGALLHAMSGTQVTDGFGVSYDSIGDVNGDGHDDVVIGSPFSDIGAIDAGKVQVFSGFDGAILYQLVGDSPGQFFGYRVSGVGDTNQDGVSDFAVSANEVGAPGVVTVYSGLDGTLRLTLTSGTASTSFGFGLSEAGDVNADGFADILVASPGSTMMTLLPTGRAHVFSGLDGSVLFLHGLTLLGGELGHGVSSAGDFDGDGRDDVMVGQPQTTSVGGSYVESQTGVVVYSGANSSVLYSNNGEYPFAYADGSWPYGGFGDGYARAFTGGHDLNADGYSDLVIGVPFHVENNVEVGRVDIVYGGPDFLGSNSFNTQSIIGTVPNENFGSSVCVVGDVNGDGIDDLAIGADGSAVNGANSGRIYVYHSPSNPVVAYSTKTYARHFLGLRWAPTFGVTNALTGVMTCEGATPFAAGLIGVSLAEMDVIAFGFLPIIVDNSASNLLFTANVFFDENGELSTFIQRSNPSLAGLNLYVQGFEVAPLTRSSNALRILATL